MKKYLLTFSILLLIFYDTSAQVVANGDFELGPTTGWTRWSKGGYQLIGTGNFFYSTDISPTVYPRSGQYMARLGGYSYEENYIKQTVTLPNTPNVYMGLYYQDRAFTGTECNGLWVGAQIRVLAAGQVILDRYLCYYNTVNEWTFIYFDLSAARGLTIEIGVRADAANTMWSYLYLDDIVISSTITDVPDQNIPTEFQLNQNYPNPFNPSTVISYSIPKTTDVKIEVYNLLGQKIATLFDDVQYPGTHELEWDSETEFRNDAASGVYLLKMQAGHFIQTKKMVLVR